MPERVNPCPYEYEGKLHCYGDLTLSDVFGHDSLGHKISNALCREEKRTIEAVAAMSDEELLDIRVIGKNAVTRIRKRLEALESGESPDDQRINKPEKVRRLARLLAQQTAVSLMSEDEAEKYWDEQLPHRDKSNYLKRAREIINFLEEIG